MRIAVPISLALTLVVLSAQAVPTITGGYIEAVRAKSTRVAACSLEGRPARVEKPSWPGTIREGEFSGISPAGVKMAAVLIGDAHLGLATSRRQQPIHRQPEFCGAARYASNSTST
jgi:hypothetical protein